MMMITRRRMIKLTYEQGLVLWCYCPSMSSSMAAATLIICHIRLAELSLLLLPLSLLSLVLIVSSSSFFGLKHVLCVTLLAVTMKGHACQGCAHHTGNYRPSLLRRYCCLSSDVSMEFSSQYGTDTTEIPSTVATCRCFRILFPLSFLPMKWLGPSTSTAIFSPFKSMSASTLNPL